MKNKNFLYDYFLRILEITQKSNETVNSKIRGLIQLNSTMLGILFGLTYFLINSSLFNNIIFKYYYSIIIISFFLSLILVILRHIPSPLKFPKPRFWIDKLSEDDSKFVNEFTLTSLAYFVDENQEMVKSKAKWVNYSVLSAFSGSIMLVFLTIGLVLR